MKTVAVSEETWKKLKELKEKLGAQSFDEIISALIETWHLQSLKEQLARVDLKLSYQEARRFIDVLHKRGSKT